MMFSDIKQTSPSTGIGESPSANRISTPSSPPEPSNHSANYHVQKNKNGGDASMNPKKHNALIVIEPPGLPIAFETAEVPVEN